MTIFQSSYHRLLLNNLPASGVDYDRSRFQQPNPSFTYQTNRIRFEGHMNTQDVRLSKHLFYVLKIFETPRLGILAPWMVDDAHRERMCQNREAHPDASEAENCESFACNVVSSRTDSFRFPFEFSKGTFCEGVLTKSCEQEVQRRSGSCIVYRCGGVREVNAYSNTQNQLEMTWIPKITATLPRALQAWTSTAS